MSKLGNWVHNKTTQAQVWAVEHGHYWLNDVLLDFHSHRNIWRKIAYGYNWVFDRMPWTKPARFIAHWVYALAGEDKAYVKVIGRNHTRLSIEGSPYRVYVKTLHFCGYCRITTQIENRANDYLREKPEVLAQGFCFSKRGAYRVVEEIVKKNPNLMPAGWIYNANWGKIHAIADVERILDGKRPEMFMDDKTEQAMRATRKKVDQLCAYSKGFLLSLDAGHHWWTQIAPIMLDVYRFVEKMQEQTPPQQKKTLADLRIYLKTQREWALEERPPYKCHETMWFDA